MRPATHLAEFEGATCHGLVAQEYRHHGALADPVNVLYLAVAPNR